MTKFEQGKLMAFLYRFDLMEIFFKNLLRSKDIDFLLRISLEDVIIGAFLWSGSDEGQNFWSTINSYWLINICKKRCITGKTVTDLRAFIKEQKAKGYVS